MPIRTGSLGSGISTLGLLQLGGPPAYPSATWTQSLPQEAKPFLAHVYASDGVTFIQSLGPLLNRPDVHFLQTNGSYDPILLEVAAGIGSANVYGSRVFGGGVYGGATVSLGNVVKLYEQGGDGTLIVAGTIYSMPEKISPTGTKHQIQIRPFAQQLSETQVQLNYTTPTDVAQMVRDAVAATPHCHCDQTSVPASTGLTGIMDFRNRPAIDVLNNAAHIAGWQWFWHCGAGGRVWFQPMGSGTGGPGTQVYTAKLHADYEERDSNGGDTFHLKNDILAVGGMTKANVTAQARYSGISQATLGKKSLNPPLSFPEVSDVPTLQTIVNSVGAVLDRVWNRATLKLLPTFGTRINAEQPGGAMLRYVEEAGNPLPESSTGTGVYVGPYVVHDVTLSGAKQTTTSGDAPVTDVHDFDVLVRQAVARAAAAALSNPLSPLVTPH